MSMMQSFQLALKSLATSKTRALLTMLGIIIGVGAVIVIVSLGDGMTSMMEDQFNSMGANLIQVRITGRGDSSRTVTVDDMYELVEQNPTYLASLSPYVMVSGSAKTDVDTFVPSSFLGVSEEYAKIRNKKLQEGRFIQYIDVARMQNVCVIGTYIENEYLGGNALNKTISINGYKYTVIGILEESADGEKATDDDQILIPYTNATRLNGNSTVNIFMLSGVSSETAVQARSIVETRLFQTYQDTDVYTVMTSAEIMDMMDEMMGTLMLVLVAIAAISLLVGGIGIMNIMLVSVTERTREIGIRKSLGAKRGDIRSQFVIEAGTTSAIGGVIGIVLGCILSVVVGQLVGQMMGNSDFTASPSLAAIALAFGVSVAIGIVFGYLPANNAAKLNPIDALRHD
ncbi:MAG: ABC transporter permease [Oscillospiraceae bacterium]|nr:ABC transporter permease [Oscillospiraceae bacterium]